MVTSSNGNIFRVTEVILYKLRKYGLERRQQFVQ